MVALIKSYELEAGTGTVSLMLSEGCQHVWYDFDSVCGVLIDLAGFRSDLLTFSLARW